ncbi:MAG: hypothetical protein AUK44_09745 [Porphyromonadaceae bacterium CG2_30_38_12]|nr:MAG: hypothetical protein AUK44_09745 [Porphyromonadaceae bacterium CG2_30_38_12]
MFEKNLSLLLIALLFATVLSAREPGKLALSIELGAANVNGSLNEAWSIRQDIGYYSDGYSNYATSDMNLSQLAAILSYSLYDNLVQVGTGLQFTNIDSNITGSNTIPFFYLRYLSEQSVTEYAKIKSLNESTNYLVIPFDLKLVPLSLWKAEFFVRSGIDVGVQVSSKTKIDFVNASMKPYNDQILNSVGVKINPFYSSWNSSIGVTVGSRVKYNIEVLLPSFLLTNSNSSIFVSSMFTGFRFSAQLPL